jgi:radical SAM-linked protein
MAYSAGFSPHPKISFAGAAPTGAASEAEYLEIAVTRRQDPGALRQALDDALPPGLDVVEVVEAGPGALADRLQASLWRVELPEVDRRTATDAVRAFLSAERVEVQRATKNGSRTFDTRSAVLQLTTVDVNGGYDRGLVAGSSREIGHGEENPTVRVAQDGTASYAILHVVVRHTTPAVRPDDVLAGLRSQAYLAPPSSPRMTRLAQGPLDEENGAVADPLTADRNVVGA